MLLKNGLFNEAPFFLCSLPLVWRRLELLFPGLKSPARDFPVTDLFGLEGSLTGLSFSRFWSCQSLNSFVVTFFAESIPNLFLVSSCSPTFLRCCVNCNVWGVNPALSTKPAEESWLSFNCYDLWLELRLPNLLVWLGMYPIAPLGVKSILGWSTGLDIGIRLK